MSDCLFCRIASGEIPSRKVYEDDRFLAFEDISPQAPTHLLLIPKEHVADLQEASENEDLLGAMVSRSARIARERGVRDYRLVANTGAAAGQSVFHLHFHILGGRPFRWPPG
jgi:histidine triad (HIT) family protein